MTNQTTNFELGPSITKLIKQIVIWIPIVIGIVHQLLMWRYDVDRIYVFLEPPGYIYPFVTLETGWWLVLTLATSFLTILALTNLIRPRRIVYPFYTYLLFLLICVKPI
jgi:hypothetical protein